MEVVKEQKGISYLSKTTLASDWSCGFTSVPSYDGRLIFITEQNGSLVVYDSKKYKEERKGTSMCNASLCTTFT